MVPCLGFVWPIHWQLNKCQLYFSVFFWAVWEVQVEMPPRFVVISPNSHDLSRGHSHIMHDSIKNHRFGWRINALESYGWGLSNKYNISLWGYFFTENVFILIFISKMTMNLLDFHQFLMDWSSNKLHCPCLNDWCRWDNNLPHESFVQSSSRARMSYHNRPKISSLFHYVKPGNNIEGGQA